MHQALKYYRVQACIRTASFKVRTSPQIEDGSYVGNLLLACLALLEGEANRASGEVVGIC